jgi:hypothetical protein
MSRPIHAPPGGPGDSDKVFWHRYVEFYESEFALLGDVSRVLEFGVLDGRSIRWLADRFPGARIVGGDLLSPRPEWPSSPRIEYATVDQGSIDQVRALLDRLAVRFDLIIDDGSHLPIHQRNCLVECLPHLRDGGMYVVEDIHTSHPAHEFYRQLGTPQAIGPLHLLLAIEHLKSAGADLEPAIVRRLAGGLFSAEDVERIFRRTARVRFHRRASLPLRCYRCGRSDYDYAALRCRCGVDLYAAADSITAVIHLAR